MAACVILIWGVTFVNTRAPLEDFSALEILVGRFALAWVALWGWGRVAARPESAPYRRGWCDEWLFAAMGFCGIFCHRVNKRAHGEIHLRQGIGSQAAEASVAIRRLRTGRLLDHETGRCEEASFAAVASGQFLKYYNTLEIVLTPLILLAKIEIRRGFSTANLI